MSVRLAALALLLHVTVQGVASDPAHACACCTNDAQRTDATDTVDDYVANVLSEIDFGAKAHLYVGNAELEGAWAALGSP